VVISVGYIDTEPALSDVPAEGVLSRGPL